MNPDIFWPAAVNLFAVAVPMHLIAYSPFRDRLRFPLRNVLAVVLLLQLVQSVLYGAIISQGGSGKGAELILAAFSIGIDFFSVRDNRPKILFLYLFVTDYVIIVRGFSAFLEANLFFRPDMVFFTYRSTLIYLLALGLSAPFMLRLFSEAREKVFGVDAPGFWRTAWIVPAFTTVVVMIFTFDFEPQTVRSFSFLLARVLLLLCTLVVYSTLLGALDSIRRQAALAEQAQVQEQLLNLQRMQHEQLLQYNEEVKAARHDLRQHLNVIWAYLDRNDIGGLKDYLTAYEKKLPPDIRRTFTKNFALNAVCTRYAEEARKYGIDYDVELDMPEKLPLNEPEVCALLGNLLENAVDACKEVRRSAPFLRVRGAWEDSHIVFAVDNSCEQKPVWKDGRLLSSKRKGFGTGTWAIQKAAERCGGMARFTYQDGIFSASVFLYA